MAEFIDEFPVLDSDLTITTRSKMQLSLFHIPPTKIVHQVLITFQDYSMVWLQVLL